jgi:hypothetical protein
MKLLPLAHPPANARKGAPTMTFDPACEDLAELFLDDPPQRSLLLHRGLTINQIDALRPRLAQHIQDAVEDWFAQLDAEREETSHAD